jgi:SAM-dependent methyltransferase
VGQPRHEQEDELTSTPPLTLVGRLMQSRAAVAVISRAPVPLWVLRKVLQRDNVRENARDGWQRLRDDQETARYVEVRRVVEKYAGEGVVLDLGCSQGILQEGLRYGRYVGVDSAATSIDLAQEKADEHTRFVLGDVSTYRPEQAPDATVLNEVIYYLPDPLQTVQRQARFLAPGGVMVISLFARAWSCRRLLRRISARLELVETALITSGHLAWTVAVYRPRA